MHKTVPDLVKSAARKYKDKTAFQIKRGFRTERFSFKQVYKDSLKLSAYLKNLGLKKGDKVLILAPNMPEWIMAYLGAVNLGVVVVPVDVQTHLETVSKFVKQSEPKLIFRSKFVRGDAAGLKVKPLFLEELVKLVEGLPLYKGNVRLKGDDLLCISYTSGTTGEPKGVMLTHKNLLSNLEMVLEVLPLDENLVTLSILPLSHAYGQMADILAPFRIGAKVVFINKLNAITVARTLKKNKVTTLTVVPQILRFLLDDIEYHVKEQKKEALYNLSLALAKNLPLKARKLIFRKIHQSLGGSLQFMVSGSAPLDLKLATTWEKFGIPILEGYGATECSAAVSINTFKNKRSGSVGKVLPGVKVRLDENREILILGPNVSRGYYQNKAKTEKAFKNGWYYTDDIGYFDEDGYLYILGREKFKIVRSDGTKVYVEDVEKKLNKHPHVWDSCVIGVKRKEGDVVYAVLITKKRDNLEKIIHEVNKELESHQQIMEYSIWPDEDFPRLSTLKIDRNKVLVSIERGSSIFDKKKLSEVLETKDKLQRIIFQVSQVDPKSIKENMNLCLDLDLDSLKRVELISLIEEELGVLLDEAKITPRTTVKSLKALVKGVPRSHSLEEPRIKPFGVLKNSIRYLALKLIAEPLHGFFVKIKEVEGTENFKKIKGPAIIIMNHPGVYDYLCLIRVLPKELLMRFTGVADDTHWHNFIHRFFHSNIAGALPINKRGGPVRESLETIGEFLDSGWVVGIAPEGKYSEKGRIGEFKEGTGLMAVEMKVPAVPFKIGSEYHKIFPPGKTPRRYFPKRRGEVAVKIGEPIVFEKGISYKEATKIMREAIENL